MIRSTDLRAIIVQLGWVFGVDIFPVRDQFARAL